MSDDVILLFVSLGLSLVFTSEILNRLQGFFVELASGMSVFSLSEREIQDTSSAILGNIDQAKLKEIAEARRNTEKAATAARESALKALTCNAHVFVASGLIPLVAFLNSLGQNGTAIPAIQMTTFDVVWYMALLQLFIYGSYFTWKNLSWVRGLERTKSTLYFSRYKLLLFMAAFLAAIYVVLVKPAGSAGNWPIVVFVIFGMFFIAISSMLFRIPHLNKLSTYSSALGHSNGESVVDGYRQVLLPEGLTYMVFFAVCTALQFWLKDYAALKLSPTVDSWSTYLLMLFLGWPWMRMLWAYLTAIGWRAWWGLVGRMVTPP
jgi:hypothetical protein